MRFQGDQEGLYRDSGNSIGKSSKEEKKHGSARSRGTSQIKKKLLIRRS